MKTEKSIGSLRIPAIIAVVGTVLDGILSYIAIVVWELGREGNPLLNTVTSYYTDMGLSHAQAFGIVMFYRVVLGVFMVGVLWMTARWQIATGRVSWFTFRAIPFVAVVFVLLTLYHAVLLSMRAF